MSASAFAAVNAGYTFLMPSKRLPPAAADEKSTLMLVTTTSLAEIPAISATTNSHILRPQGASNGAIFCAANPAKDVDAFSVKP